MRRTRERSARAFTLLELLIVAIVLVIAAALLIWAFPRGRRSTVCGGCVWNLRTISHAIAIYRVDYRDELPPWLSNLYPAYAKDKRVFLCPADRSKGLEGGIPPWSKGSQFGETDDNANCTSVGITIGCSLSSCRARR